MKYENIIEYEITGRYALFTDPLTKLGGEKFSYQVPTYQALKGITESIYWKPSFTWYIDDVRIMNRIRTSSQGVRPLNYGDVKSPILSIYTYLFNVRYQVRAHFEWNKNREDLKEDWNEDKHWQISRRMLEKGGRRDVFLGTRECQATVFPSKFGTGEGAYDGVDMSFGIMVHGITYPDEAFSDLTRGKMTVRLWNPIMRDGRIHFIRPEDCTIISDKGERNIKVYKKGINFSGWEKTGKEEDIY